MPLDMAELDRRFNYHVPDDEQKERMESSRKGFRNLATVIIGVTSPGREQSLAITALEEAQYHTIAAIAREGH